MESVSVTTFVNPRALKKNLFWDIPKTFQNVPQFCKRQQDETDDTWKKQIVISDYFYASSHYKITVLKGVKTF